MWIGFDSKKKPVGEAKDPGRKKREATVEANNTWSDLADEIEILVRFLMDGMDVVKW